MDKLTLDMTVIRDAVDVDRPRHAHAQTLLALAERGEVELGIPPQGSLADLHGRYEDSLAKQLEGLAGHPGVVRLRQLAYLSDVTFPGVDLLPGAGVEGFADAWDDVCRRWNGPGKCPKAADRWYVETHVHESRDVLVTDDSPLRHMCQRLRDEYGYPIVAESLADCVARYSSGPAGS